jgi:hypothetical protein
MSATLEVATGVSLVSAARWVIESGADLVEYYFEHGWTDGLPVVPPTPEKIEAMVEALGGDPQAIIARVAPARNVLPCCRRSFWSCCATGGASRVPLGSQSKRSYSKAPLCEPVHLLRNAATTRCRVSK